MKKLVVFPVLLSILASCSSTTNIRSTDPNAKIYVDGEYKGTGTATHTDAKTILSAPNQVRIQKEGCQPQNYAFSRNEEFDIGACIGGVLVLVPFLWVQKYKPERIYDYECVKTNASR